MAKPLRVGRYLLFGEIASGGMATVHYGRMRGAASFARIVAIKRLHPHLAKDGDFATMFLDEARIAARIQHPNAANILDVVSLPEGELLIVMEYIAGESFSRLLRRLRADGELPPSDVTCAIACDALQGLHAAHEAKNDQGEPLGIIHRDVSPHNLLVGGDGITRLVDFGVAKATGRIHATRDGQVKGKLAYMPPEQLRGQTIDRRCDVYAMGVVLWEALTTERLFAADSEGETVTNVLERNVPPPSQIVPTSPKAIDAIVLKALSRDPKQRYASARDMAAAIESATAVASARKVGSWIHTVAGDVLTQRQRIVAELERRSEDEDSSVGTPSGMQVPGESQVSSVSMTTDAPRAGRRRLAFASVALLVVVGGAFGVFAWRTRFRDEVAAVPSAHPTATSEIAPVMTTSANAPATGTIASAATTASAGPMPTVGERMARTTPLRTPVRASASASSEKPCPVKTFVDADGIVQFRRECPP